MLAEKSSTIKKLRQVGASKVVLPASIGADRLAHMILRPSAESLLQQAELPESLNEDLASIGVRLDELVIQSNSPLIGNTLSDFRLQCRIKDNGFLVVAIRRADGTVLMSPPADAVLVEGDCVIILAQEADIAKLCDLFSLHSELAQQAPQADAPTSLPEALAVVPDRVPE